VIFGDCMKELCLKGKYSNFTTKLDDVWFDFFKDWNITGLAGKTGIIYAWGRPKHAPFDTPSRYLHRIILNAPKGIFTDHKDRNGLNNQEDNLRLCTNRQNQLNSKKRMGTSSRFRNVCFNYKNHRWQASAKLKEKLIYLGCFVTEEQAAIAYNDFAVENYDPEFVIYNQVDSICNELGILK